MIDETERRNIRRGSIATSYLLKLPADLSEEARASAEAEGVTLAEWWRQAGAERLRRLTRRAQRQARRR